MPILLDLLRVYLALPGFIAMVWAQSIHYHAHQAIIAPKTHRLCFSTPAYLEHTVTCRCWPHLLNAHCAHLVYIAWVMDQQVTKLIFNDKSLRFIMLDLPTGPCAKGYYCSLGASVAMPNDNFATGGVCRDGYVWCIILDNFVK